MNARGLRTSVERVLDSEVVVRRHPDEPLKRLGLPQAKLRMRQKQRVEDIAH